MAWAEAAHRDITQLSSSTATQVCTHILDYECHFQRDNAHLQSEEDLQGHKLMRPSMGCLSYTAHTEGALLMGHRGQRGLGVLLPVTASGDLQQPRADQILLDPELQLNMEETVPALSLFPVNT